MRDKKVISAAKAEFAASVVRAAWRLFVENGYVGTSMDDVAAAVGVSKPTVYEAYRNKQALFEAAIEEVTNEFTPATSEAIANYDGSLADLFRAIPGLARSFIKQQRRTEVVRVLVSEARRMPSLVSKYREALWEAELAAWAKLLQRAMDRGEFRRMDPFVGARICVAPAINIMIERIMYGDKAVDDKIVNAYLEEAYAAVSRACLLKSGT